MTDKICTFIGHRDAPDSLLPKLENAIEHLITEKGVEHFYVGHNGRFDALAQSTLAKFYLRGKLSYNIVLSFMPQSKEKFSAIDYSKSIYPNGLENTPRRFSVYNRNIWMLNHSHYLIAYVGYIGNAAKFLEIAQKKKKEIINLYE